MEAAIGRGTHGCGLLAGLRRPRALAARSVPAHRVRTPCRRPHRDWPFPLALPNHRNRRGRVLRDGRPQARAGQDANDRRPQTRQEVQHRRKDTLFFITLKWVAIPYGLVALFGVLGVLVTAFLGRPSRQSARAFSGRVTVTPQTGWRPAHVAPSRLPSLAEFSRTQLYRTVNILAPTTPRARRRRGRRTM